MNLDIDEFLPDEEKRRIAEEVFRHFCEKAFRTHAERIFTNAAYHAVWNVVDEMFDGNAAQAIAQKIPGVIETLSEYSVFRSGGDYGRKPSVGQIVLGEVIKENRPAIDAAVKKAAASLTKQDIEDALWGGKVQITISNDQ